MIKIFCTTFRYLIAEVNEDIMQVMMLQNIPEGTKNINMEQVKK